MSYATYSLIVLAAAVFFGFCLGYWAGKRAEKEPTTERGRRMAKLHRIEREVNKAAGQW